MYLPTHPNRAAQLDLSAAMDEVYADRALSAKFECGSVLMRGSMETGVKLVAAYASSPGLSRRSRSGGQCADYRDGRDKPGHDQVGTATSFAPRKKLTCADRATSSPCWRCHKHGSGGDRRDLHSIAKFSQAFDQAIFLLVGGTTIEVIAAEILICRPVLEHVVDRGKVGGGDGHDRLLGAAPGFDAVELGLQVAVFLFYRRPGALHQRGL